MKKVLLLSSDKGENRKQLLESMNNKLKGEISFSLNTFENISLSFSKDNLNGYVSGVDLKNFDFVYIRRKTNFTSLARTVSIFLKANNIPFADEAIFDASYMGNKLTSLARLAYANIPVSPTAFIFKIDNSELIKALGFPLVAKRLTVQHMAGVYSFKNETQLEEFFNSHNPKDFLFQKYLDIENEYRILVINGQAVTAHNKIKRKYTSGLVDYADYDELFHFLDPKTLPKELTNLAQEAATSLKINIAGVDVCQDKEGNAYVIEVNRGPGIEYDPKKPEEVNALVNFFKNI